MDPQEKHNWARHYDTLLWTSLAIMFTAIGGLLSYLALVKFNLLLAFLVINIIILTVYFSASFRELRFIFQDIEEEGIKKLIDNREFLQWWPYIIIFLLLCLVWVKILLDNLPEGSVYWLIIGIINFIFIITLGIRANGSNLKERKERIQKGEKVNERIPHFWLFVIISIIIIDGFLIISFLNKWNILLTSSGPTVIIFSSLVVLMDKIERRVIVNWHSYYSRVIFSSLYLITGFAILLIFKDKIFYAEKMTDFTDIFRFIWCINSSLFGFALIVSQSRFHPRLPYGPYLFYYPPILLVISALIYSLLSIFNATNNHIFYFFSFSLCFILAFLIDKFWEIILKLIEKARIEIGKFNI